MAKTANVFKLKNISLKTWQISKLKIVCFRLESEKVKIIMSNTRDAREQRARSRMLERE
jgi:hypothetical protein